MQIAVYISRIPDPASVEVDALSGMVDQKSLVYITSPPDLRAVEEALRIREQTGGQVTVFGAGARAAEDSLRECLAMGVDCAVRIWGSGWEEDPAPPFIARALARGMKTKLYDLILCGDAGSHLHVDQVPAWIAESLRWPLITTVTQLKIGADQRVIVQRKLEKGRRQVLEVTCPAVLTVDISLNEPRECALDALISARQSDIDLVDIPFESIAAKLPAICRAAGNRWAVKPLRPEPQVIFTPDPSLPAHERIKQIIYGWLAVKKGLVVQGAPEEVAEEILSFLINKGIYPQRK